MNLQCSCMQILFIFYYLKAESKNNQVTARKHTRVIKDWIESYEKYNVQESDQALNRPSESFEFNKVLDVPNIHKKRMKKHKKKLGKRKSEKDKWTKKNKISKGKSKPKGKRKKTTRKFVKTVDDRSKDSNISASKEIEGDENPVDIIVHIKMSD